MGKVSPFPFLPPLLSLVALLGLISTLAGATAVGSIHDLLRAHGLPGGLLPKAVESFALDQDTGLLDVRLDRPCYAKYDGDLALFDQVVRGNLSFGELRGVEGLSQEELFVWLPVKGILVADPSSGVILFDIGLAHKRLSRSVFEEPPDCQPEGEKAVLFPGEGLLGREEGLQLQRSE
ncbi:uncharacterized protein [Typha angustifolia]|uniref:uncharacterized protein n=1 Tax=Typha angustifolia TaxID=59011 RepID=UPI003C2E22ED